MAPSIIQADLDSLIDSHPILAILLSENLLNRSSLEHFIPYSIAHSVTGTIPQTFTEFYGDYVNFRMVEHVGDAHRSPYCPTPQVDLRIDETLVALAKIAYRHRVKGKQIYGARVAQGLPKMRRGVPGGVANLEFCSFGLLCFDCVEENGNVSVKCLKKMTQ